MGIADEIERLTAEDRAFRIADAFSYDYIESTGIKTNGICEFRFEINDISESDLLNDCINHLEYRGLATKTETDDNIFIFFLEGGAA